MKADYTTNPDTGMYVLEEGLVEIGRAGDVPWLIDQIESLSTLEFLERFTPWPSLAEPEGVWGALLIDPYAIMCQLDVPTNEERKLGAEPMLKVDRASTREHILALLRELG